MFRTLLRQSIQPKENLLIGYVPMRTKSLMRQKPTDTSKMIPLLDETQLFVPVVHRRHPVGLRPINGPYKKLRSRHYVYDEIKLPRLPMPEIEVILVQDVPGKGVKGTKVKLPGDKAYAELLIPQFAVYASPENETKYASLIQDVKKNSLFSTLSAQQTAHNLSQRMVFVFMNMRNPWTVEKWHVRVAFRQSGIILTDECIELPQKPITGPDPNKEGKHFLVNITINGKERVAVLCRLNHFINDEELKLPLLPHFTPPYGAIFEEDTEEIEKFIHRRSEIIRFKF